MVGVTTWELHLEGCHSLKDKRHILRSLKDRMRARFNVSVAETDHNDVWQRAELTACVVSNQRTHAQEVLQQVDRMVASTAGARVMDQSTSYL